MKKTSSNLQKQLTKSMLALVLITIIRSASELIIGASFNLNN